MTSVESVVSEGRAKIFTSNNTFYNPVQEFNRDMSIVALTVFAEQCKPIGREKHRKRPHSPNNLSDPPEVNDYNLQEGIVVLEALAATGLRSIRYALEVPNVKVIYANDCSQRAVEIMKRNIEENKVQSIVETVNHDAVWLMQKFSFENKSINAIDLDPYGCPTRFLDSAVNCIATGGLLMITCTDMAVIAGNTPETCYVKYGSISLRSSACHEMALRIALSSLASHCGRYGKYIVPLLSISADFYIRIFVRVYASQNMCKQTSSNVSMVFQCTGCEMMTLQPLGMKTQRNNNWKYTLPPAPPVSDNCMHCNHKFRLGGPIWSGPLHDSDFIDAMLSKVENSELGTSKRIYGMLSLIREELSDIPLYYTVDSLCSKIHCQMIPLLDFRCALLNAGYRVSSSHCKSNSVKTDAPQVFIWDILRSWVQKYPVSKKRLEENGVTASILGKQPQSEVNFRFCPNAIPASSSSGLLRYQPNPQPNWGPGTRSKSNILQDTDISKKVKNQNKKTQSKTRIQLDISSPERVKDSQEMVVEKTDS